jgi:transcriptional regulator with XRE-family HTH domain
LRSGRNPRAVHDPRYKEMLARLREARKLAGLTQVEAAEALGRTQAWVSKCELGERRIDPLDLQAFAALYGQPFSYFLPRLTRRTR